jgi:hypothetical protein
VSETCPECKGALECIEVDIGIGMQKGPPYCPDCGWSPPPFDPSLLHGDDRDSEPGLSAREQRGLEAEHMHDAQRLKR